MKVQILVFSAEMGALSPNFKSGGLKLPLPPYISAPATADARLLLLIFLL